MSSSIGNGYVHQSAISQPVMGKCFFFGGRATPLKAAKHKAVSAPAVKAIKTPPPIPMPQPPPLIPFRGDRYTP